MACGELAFLTAQHKGQDSRDPNVKKKKEKSSTGSVIRGDR